MKSPRAETTLLLLSLLAPLGCGDALVNASYRGEPIFVVQGRIESFTAPAGIRFEDYTVLASLFWVTDLDSQGALVEQPSVSAQVAFPATIELRVFEAPRPEHFLVLAEGVKVAFGALLVYVDVDRNGRYSEGDRLIGGSGRTGLLYAEQEIPLGTGPINVFVPAGFSVRQLDVLCENQTEPVRTELEFTGLACDLDLSCADNQRCLPVGRFCVTVEGPGVTRCSVESPCSSDRLVCHPEARICIPRASPVEQLCRTESSCAAGQACLDYLGCMLPVRPEPVPSCDRDADCAPLGFVCAPDFGICVPNEALELNVPGTYEPAVLTCQPDRS